MEKEQNSNNEEHNSETKQGSQDETLTKESDQDENKEKIIELTPEEKICELEDKLTRTFAEM